MKSLGIRSRGVNIISCPSCARQAFPVIETVKKLEKRLSHLKEPITLSIIGCVVNGPGEAAQTEIGLTGGGNDSNLLYLSGEMAENLVASLVKYEDLVEHKSSSPTILVLCRECKHLAQDEERHKQHVGEARHVHPYRHLAYRIG